MNKIVIALIVGILLGAAGTLLIAAAPQIASEPQAEHPAHFTIHRSTVRYSLFKT